LTSGSVISRLDNFVNLDAFISTGRCVNNQNQIVPSADPGWTDCSAFGNIGRNVFRGPFQTNHDMSLVKRTNLTERVNIEFRAEAFNLTNTPSFAAPNTNVDTAAGGRVTSTLSLPRQIQFAIKYNF